MSGRNVLNGAQVIVDYLINEKVPYVSGQPIATFTSCGPGSANRKGVDADTNPAGARIWELPASAARRISASNMCRARGNRHPEVRAA